MANDLNRSIKIYIDGSEAQQGIAKVEVNPQEEKPKERTMTTFQARKRWSRKAS